MSRAQAAGESKPTKNEVELERLKVDFRIRRLKVVGFIVVAGVVASAVPLYFFRDMVTPFAGRETRINANVGLTITASLSIALNGVQLILARQRKRSLQRQRSQLNELEEAVGITFDD